MTPMQEQYNRIKSENPGTVILFRMGDFYETFDSDAELVSRVLGITLTSRGKDENRQPLAGIPYHALPTYMPRLVEAGLKVAIAEQMEQHILLIVHIDVLIDHDDELGEAHLPGAPDRVHDATGLAGIFLADLDERAIVKRAADR